MKPKPADGYIGGLIEILNKEELGLRRKYKGKMLYY
jgi:hypothetical protein